MLVLCVNDSVINRVLGTSDIFSNFADVGIATQSTQQPKCFKNQKLVRLFIRLLKMS